MASILGKVLDLLVELLQFLNGKKKDDDETKVQAVPKELEIYRREMEEKMREMELNHKLSTVSKTQEYTEEEVKMLRKKVDLLEARIAGLVESVYLARLQEPPHTKESGTIRTDNEVNQNNTR